MRIGLSALAVAAVVGLGAMMAGGAHAGPLSPSTAAAAAASGAPAAVETVAWVCRNRNCVWDPRFRGPPPPYARRWGPPRHPWCRWQQVRTPYGWRWVQVCRR